MDSGMIKNDEVLHDLEEFFDGIRRNSQELRNTPTNKNIIKVREGKKDVQGNIQYWKYITRLDAMKWLDESYPGWSWEFHCDSLKELAGLFIGSGTLTVIHKGLKRSFTTIGDEEIIFKKETKEPVIKNYAKSVDTDALKRAVFTLGGFTDVYTEIDLHSSDLTEDEFKYYFENIFPLYFKRCQDSNDNYGFTQLQKQVKLISDRTTFEKIKNIINEIKI